MGESHPTFRYRISQGKNVTGLEVAIAAQELPYVIVQKSGHSDSIPSVPFVLPIKRHDCYLYQPSENGVKVIEANQAFIEIPNYPDKSWVLPLFYFANTSFGPPNNVSYSEKLINHERSVALLPKTNPMEKIRDMFSIYSAIQYLQKQTS